ncbi:MAG: DUF6263 family protein [Prevotellaceae bacterium]|jgi:hypothetical protein|nr:DUF6263 family protein [Prevotellaceae bacterium]
MRHLLKKFTAITGILSIALTIACCQESEKYTLELKFNKGDILKQKMVSDIETSIAGQKIAMIMEIAYSFDVKEVMNDGFLLNLKYDAMKLNMPLMGISLDSNTEDDIITLQNFSPLFKLLTKQSFELQMNKGGKIESFKGMDNLVEKIAAAFDPSVPDEMKTQLIEQFGNQYSQESIKGVFEQMGAFYPATPVNVGAKWTHELELPVNSMSFKINLTMTLKGVENEVALIDLDATVASVENAVLETNGIQIPVSLNGTQKGTAKVDMKTGWTIESTITQNISGNMEVMGMKTDMSIVTKTQVSQ